MVVNTFWDAGPTFQTGTPHSIDWVCVPRTMYHSIQYCRVLRKEGLLCQPGVTSRPYDHWHLLVRAHMQVYHVAPCRAPSMAIEQLSLCLQTGHNRIQVV